MLPEGPTGTRKPETSETEMAKIEWFSPKEIPNVEELKKISDAFYESLGLPQLPLKIIYDDWEEAGRLLKIKDQSVEEFAFDFMNISDLDQLHYLATNRRISAATQMTIRQGKLNSIKNSVYEVAEVAAEYSNYCIGWSLEREKHNPFEPLINNIFGKGLVFLGPIKGNSVIFVPPIKN
jgi:hypothetical protein